MRLRACLLLKSEEIKKIKGYFMIRVIGLAGAAGCGKTTIAHYLVEQYDFVRVRFADTLKNMLKAAGLTDRHLDGDLKEVPTDLLCGKTPRWVMQQLGTEFFRNQVGRDFWVNAWSRRAQTHLDMGDWVVADDMRFPNEAATISKLGGTLAHITRPDNQLDVGVHESEAHSDSLDYDVHIVNGGTLGDLFRQVDFRLIRGETVPEPDNEDDRDSLQISDGALSSETVPLRRFFRETA
jgi:hypothetical protein